MATHPGSNESFGGGGDDSGGGSGSPPGSGEPAREPCPVIDLDAWRRRHDGNNANTICRVDRRATHAEVFGSLFAHCFAPLRELWMAHRGVPGLAVAAINGEYGQIEWRGWLPAVASRPRVLIAGRHEQATIGLMSDPSVSLRHLAIILEPLATDGLARVPRVRLVDLCTGEGFEDEHGRRRGGLVSNGPVLGSCGDYLLFLLPTGDGAPWPVSAQEAWAGIPPRQYVNAVGPAAGASDFEGRGRASGPGGCWSTIVTVMPSPSSVSDRLVGDDERPVGSIKLGANRATRRILVGARALDRGIIIGRHARCAGSEVLTLDVVSRVHLLVVRIGADVYAIDTASSHGTWSLTDEDAQPQPEAFALRDHPDLALADASVALRWRPEP